MPTLTDSVDTPAAAAASAAAPPGFSPRLEAQMREQLGIGLAALLAPINAQAPAGRSLRGSGLYQAMQEARREDDATLPMGPWQHELKQADWAQVCRQGVEALSQHSKDLQIAAWLLEARLRQAGLPALAPLLALLDGLIAGYWRDLHPALDEGDASHRGNVLRWINRKLVTTLKLVPLLRGAAERPLSWADWEQVQLLAKRRGAGGPSGQAGQGGGQGAGGSSDEPGALDIKTLAAALAAEPTAHCLALATSLQQALQSLAALVQTIDAHFSDDAPSLSAFEAVLQQMHGWIGAELLRRGVPLPMQTDEDSEADGMARFPFKGEGGDGDSSVERAEGPVSTSAATSTATSAATPAAISALDPHPNPLAERTATCKPPSQSELAACGSNSSLRPPARGRGPDSVAAAPPRNPITDRAHAYAQLASAAQTLREIDPHSPVPYVVQRAIAWGGLNTAQLYQELFVRQGGQISIFELLGIDLPQESTS